MHTFLIRAAVWVFEGSRGDGRVYVDLIFPVPVTYVFGKEIVQHLTSVRFKGASTGYFGACFYYQLNPKKDRFLRSDGLTIATRSKLPVMLSDE